MERLLLFAKVPTPGGVKTRLVPPLTPEQALALYRAFLEDQIAFVRSVGSGRDVELCLDRPWPCDAASGPRPAGIRLTEQGGGDLGRRLLRAFRRCQAERRLPAVVVAADSPTLPVSHVHDAFRRMAQGAPAVISPADDGGYVLLGMREPLASLFRDVPWSSDRVFETTCRRAAEGGIEMARLAPWYDVDCGDGLRRLRRELATPAGRLRAPATARCLRSLPGPAGC